MTHSQRKIGCWRQKFLNTACHQQFDHPSSPSLPGITGFSDHCHQPCHKVEPFSLETAVTDKRKHCNVTLGLARKSPILLNQKPHIHTIHILLQLFGIILKTFAYLDTKNSHKERDESLK